MTDRNPLYRKWLNMKKREYVPEWEEYAPFQQWCEESGYQSGMVLVRKKKELPYGPDNCFWGSRTSTKNKDTDSWQDDFCRRWARGVNPLRKAAGLPLLPEE